MDTFDADVLIYAAVPSHPLGRRVLRLFQHAPAHYRRRVGAAGTEVLSKPLRDGSAAEMQALTRLLARIDLRPVDRATAELATVLAAKYKLRAADATQREQPFLSGEPVDAFDGDHVAVDEVQDPVPADA